MSKKHKKSSRVKVVSLGSTESGKSCVIKRYCEKRFVTKYMPTVGVDFGVTKVVVDDLELKVNLFDLSGHPAFKEVRNEFYKDTQGVLLVYDVTNKASFEALDSWFKEVKQYIPDPIDISRIVFILCANKIDKKNSRTVDFVKGREWAQKHGFYYFETSSQTGDGINEAFEMLFKGLTQVIETGERPKNVAATLGYTKEQMDAIQKLKTCKDNYSRLGLSYGASQEDVSKSYRKLAKLLHPDKCEIPDSEDAFKILVAARDALINNGK
ncbi:dnaJ homolog subfamily C member 27-like [Hydractinia symbiolongicarpus]|uniref:dnaJ homolog subfamily C member 27-like n=1 Tax=Hydractinia symbiolongicarpus TaxID=13093 RepID=UPI0025500F44|nr:dnaJ homolog subfamily C member 27-like [Hydractinia symbiolongicarpus]